MVFIASCLYCPSGTVAWPNTTAHPSTYSERALSISSSSKTSHVMVPGGFGTLRAIPGADRSAHFAAKALLVRLAMASNCSDCAPAMEPPFFLRASANAFLLSYPAIQPIRSISLWVIPEPSRAFATASCTRCPLYIPLSNVVCFLPKASSFSVMNHDKSSIDAGPSTASGAPGFRALVLTTSRSIIRTPSTFVSPLRA